MTKRKTAAARVRDLKSRKAPKAGLKALKSPRPGDPCDGGEIAARLR